MDKLSNQSTKTVHIILICICQLLLVETKCVKFLSCTDLNLQKMNIWTEKPQVTFKPVVNSTAGHVNITWTPAVVTSEQTSISGLLVKAYSTMNNVDPFCYNLSNNDDGESRDIDSRDDESRDAQGVYEYGCLSPGSKYLEVFNILSLNKPTSATNEEDTRLTLFYSDMNAVNRMLLLYPQQHNEMNTAVWKPRLIELNNDSCASSVTIRFNLPPQNYSFYDITIEIYDITAKNITHEKRFQPIPYDDNQWLIVRFDNFTDGIYQMKLSFRQFSTSHSGVVCTCRRDAVCGGCKHITTPSFIVNATSTLTRCFNPDTLLQTSPVTRMTLILYVSGATVVVCIFVIIVVKIRKKRSSQLRNAKKSKPPLPVQQSSKPIPGDSITVASSYLAVGNPRAGTGQRAQREQTINTESHLDSIGDLSCDNDGSLSQIPAHSHNPLPPTGSKDYYALCRQTSEPHTPDTTETQGLLRHHNNLEASIQNISLVGIGDHDQG